MNIERKPQFSPGRNIAMKVSPDEFEKVVAFYGDVLGLPRIESDSADKSNPSTVFEFGDKWLWIDKTETVSHAEIWLEVQTDDIDSAAEYFKGKGIVRRDEIEPLPEGFNGFWIANPAGIIHLVALSD